MLNEQVCNVLNNPVYHARSVAPKLVSTNVSCYCFNNVVFSINKVCIFYKINVTCFLLNVDIIYQLIKTIVSMHRWVGDTAFYGWR